MRFLQCSVLALAMVLVLGGCGVESKKPVTVETAKAPPTGQNFVDESQTEMLQAQRPRPAMRHAAPVEVADFAEPNPAPAAEETRRRTFKAEPEASGDWARTETVEEQAENFQEQIPPGTLTAGSLNDHENLQDFRDYLSTVQQSEAAGPIPAFALGERVMIEVKDAQGNGIGNAHVIVTVVGQPNVNEGVPLETRTRADGRAFFATGIDAAPEHDTFELTVRPPGGKPIVQKVSSSQSPWMVEVPEVSAELPARLDLALVVDTTGSMSDELNYLKVEIDHIAQTIHRMYPNVDQRYSLIVYRDEYDQYLRRVFDFTGSLEDFRRDLSAQSASGGGDYPEAVHIALEAAGKLNWREENTARVLFLVADAPPHRRHVQRTFEAVRELRREGVAVYPLAGSGAKSECEYILRTSAFLTRSQYLFLTDHSGIGNPHARPTAPRYEVEPLNQLMIRMIASELAGKPVLPQEIIATEEGESGPPDFIPGEQNQSAVDPPIREIEFCGTPDGPRRSLLASIWETIWFRVAAAVVLIAGILLLDSRLRT